MVSILASFLPLLCSHPCVSFFFFHTLIFCSGCILCTLGSSPKSFLQQGREQINQPARLQPDRGTPEPVPLFFQHQPAGGSKVLPNVIPGLGRASSGIINPPGPPRLWPLSPPDLSPLQPQAQPQSHRCALPRPHGLPEPLTAPEGRALLGGYPEGQVNVGGPSGLGVVPGNSTHPLTFFRRGN